MIRTILLCAIRVVSASIQAIAWLLMAAVMLTLFSIAMLWIIVRLAYNTPMIVWHAANPPKPPVP